MLSARCHQAVSAGTASRPAGLAPLGVQRRSVQCRDAVQVLSTLAAAGDVEAPAWVPLAVAGVVTLVGTAIIPIALAPGQKEADRIFAAKQNRPLDKEPPAKGKAAAKGKKK